VAGPGHYIEVKLEMAEGKCNLTGKGRGPPSNNEIVQAVLRLKTKRNFDKTVQEK